MEDQYNVSIIIPHYNSPDLLTKLLSTIPDEKDIQTIVVDDNSPEEVKVQLQEMKSFYENRNILFLENNSSNHNCGAARNIGLKYAEGKWLLFADADDFFTDGFYNKIKKYFDSDADLVFFPPTSQELETGEISIRHLTYLNEVKHYLKKPSITAEARLRYAWPGAWSKLTRNSLVQDNNLSFESIKFSEEGMFAVQIGFLAKKIDVSKDTIYCITRSTGSLTTKTQDVDTFDVRVQERIRRFQFLKTHLTKKEFRASEAYKIAITHLLLIVQRKYGFQVFWKYFKLFKQNHMLKFDIRMFNPANIVRWVRGSYHKNIIRKYTA